jgi:HK97 family phage prohead protease
MPYYISNNRPDCNGWAMVKENDDGTYETMGCHTTKQEAIDHMVAAAVNTDGEAMGELRAVNLAPPQYMRAAARRGVELHEQGKSGDGVRPQTVEDARKMARGVVTEEKWRKIGPWIARHLVDLDAVQGDEITAGLVAHLLWGSGPSKADARRAMDYAMNVVAQLDEEQERQDMDIVDTAVDSAVDQRQLPPSYRPANSDDVPAGRSCANCEYFDAQRNYCTRWEAGCDPEMYCDAWEPREAEEMPAAEQQSSTDVMPDDEMNSRANHWVVSHGENRSVAFSNLEVRADGEGNKLVGYAAVFDSPSEPLPWTEFVRRGAFSKTINDGADVRLLVDHEGVPLARTKSGTLTLREDDKGLLVEANLDAANPDAAKVMSALRRGDVSQMSFAFETVKDAWSDDRRTRELREVRLFDVSVVTYPAYEETVVAIRNKPANDTPADTIKPSSLARRRAQIAIQRQRTAAE